MHIGTLTTSSISIFDIEMSLESNKKYKNKHDFWTTNK